MSGKVQGRKFVVDVSVDTDADDYPDDCGTDEATVLADAFFDWLQECGNAIDTPGWLFSIDGCDPGRRR